MKAMNLALLGLLLVFIAETVLAINFNQRQNRDLVNYKTLLDQYIALQAELGYVGLLHNFKNALLRPQEEQYRMAAKGNAEAALALLEDIETLGSRLTGQPMQMKETRAMVLAYRDRLDLMQDLQQQELSVFEQDRRLRFDDQPALGEIRQSQLRLNAILDSRLRRDLDRYQWQGFAILLVLFFGLLATAHRFSRSLGKSLAASEALNQSLLLQKQLLLESEAKMRQMVHENQAAQEKTSLLNRQLTASHAQMREFVYTVSHDLRSPLVSIGGFSRHLASELADQLDDRQKRRFDRIAVNVDHMGQILSDLLGLSRVLQQDIETESIDLEPFIHRQLDSLRSTLEATDTEIILHTPFLDIVANQRLLSQCIVNLVENAIKYRHPERNPRIEFRTRSEADQVWLSIIDNGMGIDAKYHERVFAIFERLSSDTEGTGIGLAIVKTAMEKHGGSVSLDSVKDIGTTIHLHFPVTAKAGPVV